MTRKLLIGLAVVGGALLTMAAGKAPDMMPMPHYTAQGQLEFPEGYREWQFVTAGHGMNYSAEGSDGPELPFDNVFVQRGAYQAFKASGHWPDGTMLVLEIRSGTQHGSINKHGAFQSGRPLRTEIHVRDPRFKDGWAFFGFGGAAENGEGETQRPAAMIGYEASCYACHQANAAVDTSFVQYYPTLLPIATAKGTLSEAYRKAEAGK